MAANRLAETFNSARAENRVAIVTYLVPGHPTPEETAGVFDAMVEGGADVVEIGIPFSDPLADGTTNQRVAFQALGNGMTPAGCIEFARAARSRHPRTPIIFMTYLNSVLAYDQERFAADAAASGVDGVILIDLPPEEAASIRRTFNATGLEVIFMVAPTSSEHRLEVICESAGGFIYCVSVAGITGARSDLPADLPAFLARVRRCTDLPLAVGFGISRRDHIESLRGIADGAVIGSAIMNLVNETLPSERPRAVREYIETLAGRRDPGGVSAKA